jgi:hypothetical protein
VKITPTIFSRLLSGKPIMAKDLGISSDQSIIKISCDDINIGLCSIDETGRLLLSDIYCPSILHYNTKSPNKEDQPCMLCGGKRGIPTLLSTKNRYGQMVCAVAMRFEIYRGIALPHLESSEISAAGDAVATALLGLICGGNNVN